MFPSRVVGVVVLLICSIIVNGFAPLRPPAITTSFKQQHSTIQNMASSIAPSTAESMVDELCHVLSDSQVNALIRIGKNPDTQKVINGFGLWALVVSLITGPIWMAAMGIVEAFLEVNDGIDPHRASFDRTGKLWAHVWLRMTNSLPTFSGDAELLQERTGPCLYVANHASWLDIPILCTVLDPVFKFIAKGELQNVPCVGHQLVGVRFSETMVRLSRVVLQRVPHNFMFLFFRAITY